MKSHPGEVTNDNSMENSLEMKESVAEFIKELFESLGLI